MKKPLSFYLERLFVFTSIVAFTNSHAQTGNPPKKQTAVIKMIRQYKGSAVELITPTDDLKGVVVKTADNSTWFLDRKESMDTFGIFINDEYWAAPKDATVIYSIPDDAPSDSVKAKKETTPAPAYFIDGKAATEAAAKALPIEKIESVNVLKSAEAIKKYGTRGKNGIVFITTKKNL